VSTVRLREAHPGEVATISATRNIVTRPPAWAYLWWLAVGALLVFGFLAQLTIGAPFFLLGVVLAVVGALRRATRSFAVSALPAGLALPLLYVAWLNRDGPGTVCTTTTFSQTCEEQWDPWPWVIAAVLMVAVSVGLTVLTRVLMPTRRG
jgi:hypothetical protein